MTGLRSDALSDAFFEARKAELEKRVTAHRFAHSLGVTDACVMLAQTYGIDAKKARLAGLLHDWDKCYDDFGIRERVREVGLEIDEETLATVPQALHGLTAARALKRDFPEIPDDVIRAISRHTVGAIDMQPLDMALYVADAIEPNRSSDRFGSIVDELRGMVGEVPLERLFFETYRFWTISLLQRGSSLYPDTINVWNEYACRLKPCGMKSSLAMRKEA